MSVALIKAGLVTILTGLDGIGKVADGRRGLPAWLKNGHLNAAYCEVTREPNSAGTEEAVGVGPVVFRYTNVRVEVWLSQAEEASQAVWDDLMDRVTAVLRENKTIGGLARVSCDEPQALVDDEQQLTDGGSDVWLHHAIYLLRVREYLPYTPN